MADSQQTAMFAILAAGGVTAAGQIAVTRELPGMRVIVATFAAAIVTTAVAEVAPELAKWTALTILVTALVASPGPSAALGALAERRSARSPVQAPLAPSPPN